jgi:molybdenum cofactor synthesis domain-containing protein
MKQIKTTNAVGHVLCHDITQIIRGEKSEAVFRKGHIVTEEDIPVLLSVGKEHLYVWEKQPGMLHENEAAEILLNICKNGFMSSTPVKEGKIELFAEVDGLLKVDVERLNQINSLGEMIIATRHSDFAVKKGAKLAGTRIVPLVIEESRMNKALAIAGKKPLLQILPFGSKKAGIVTTGNEVFSGRIQDTFGPVIRQKLAEYDVEVLGQTIVGDDPENITSAIQNYIHLNADFVICTGGMSVDPDDTTPAAIRNTGAELVSYGAPVLPGAMFLLAYYIRRQSVPSQIIPIIGLPGCVMYARRTIFDLILPRIMADDVLTSEDLSRMGHGGLCLNCEVCTFPNCGFGK